MFLPFNNWSKKLKSQLTCLISSRLIAPLLSISIAWNWSLRSDSSSSSRVLANACVTQSCTLETLFTIGLNAWNSNVLSFIHIASYFHFFLLQHYILKNLPNHMIVLSTFFLIRTLYFQKSIQSQHWKLLSIWMKVANAIINKNKKHDSKFSIQGKGKTKNKIYFYP